MSKAGRICEPRIIKCSCGDEIYLNKLKNHIIKSHKKSQDEFDLEYFNIMFKNINTDVLIKEYVNGESIFSLCKKYNLKNNDIVFMLKHLKIEKRNISESHKTLDYINKITKTTKERYGVENISKNPKIKLKKIDTMKKNFGRINNFSNPEILKRAKSNVDYEKCWNSLQITLKEKYGVDKITHIDFVKKKLSVTQKEKYQNSSKEEKERIKIKMINMRKLIKYGIRSSHELKIQNILNLFNY